MSAAGDNFREWCWALFECARNPYYILVVIYVFGPYFTQEVIGDPIRGQALWGYINGVSGAVVALCAPFLGAMADHLGRRKPGIAIAALVMAPAVFILWFAVPGAAGAAVLLIALTLTLAGICYAFSEVLHNAMLVTVAPNTLGRASGRGLAMGNAGSVTLLVLVFFGIALPASGLFDWAILPDSPWFGLDPSTAEDRRIVGPICAVWLLIFTLPLMLWVPDAPAGAPFGRAMRLGLQDLLETVREARRYANIIRYLLARMLFNDGKMAIMTFGTIYGVALFGWGIIEPLLLGIVLSVVAVIGGLMGGVMENAMGSRRALLIDLGIIAATLIFTLLLTPQGFLFADIDGFDAQVLPLPWFNTPAQLLYVGMSFLYALFITAAYANSRSLLVRIAPPESVTRFFGLYALSGQVTAFAAPLAIGLLTALTQSQRGGMLIIFAFLAAGIWLLWGVREARES
ncbi:MAG: MFS transporter [Gammaproteobacteria bacterium AqS3]|nr:MFS transporter [Gammaproteobacteria bacterium AqS3]